MRDENSSDPAVAETGQNNKTTIIVGVIVVVALLIIGWAVFRGDTPEPVVPSEEVVVEQTVTDQAPAEVMPLEQNENDFLPDAVVTTDEFADAKPSVSSEPSLPSIQTSTPALLSALSERRVNTRPVRSENLVADIVAFVDNLAAGGIARDSAIIKGPEARFVVDEIDNSAYMGTQSYQRYDNIVNWFVGLNTQAVVAVFKQYEPLFDEAYAEISRPGDTFIARFNRAVSVVNATPIQQGLIELNSDKIMYTYADEALESLPAAQRQMLRLGPNNMARVKAKLNEIQQALNN